MSLESQVTRYKVCACAKDFMYLSREMRAEQQDVTYQLLAYSLIPNPSTIFMNLKLIDLGSLEVLRVQNACHISLTNPL